MKSNKFIESKIEKLIELIPYLEIYYEFDKFSKSHFLKVLPLETFTSNGVYIEFEQEFNNEFFEKYPFELITFLSVEDSYDMVKSKKFSALKSVITTKQNYLFEQNFDFNRAIANLLLDYRIEMPTSLNFSAFINEAKFKNTYEEKLLQSKSNNSSQPVAVSVAETPLVDSDFSPENTNNNDYPLAA